MSILWTAMLVWLVTLFGHTGTAKLADWRASALHISRYRTLPQRAAIPIGYALPLCELAAAVMLSVPGTRRVGAVLACVLAAAFAVATARVLRLGIDISCGCAGSRGKARVNGLSFARAVVILVVAALLAWMPRSPEIGEYAALALAAISALPTVVSGVAVRRLGIHSQADLPGERSPAPGAVQ